MFIKPTESNVTLLFFTVSVLGYVTTYVFEWGYFTFFGLPSSLIELNLSMIIKSVLFITGLFLMGYILNYFISRLFTWLFFKKELSSRQQSTPAPKRKTGLASFLIILMAAAVLMFFFIYQAISDPEKFYYIYLSLAPIVVFYQFLNKKYLGISSVVFLLFFIVLVYSFGYNSASTQVTYLKLTETADLVKTPEKEKAEDVDVIVIRYFNNKAIVAEADLQKNIIYSKYQLIKLETEIHQLKFETVHTGKLKVENQPSPRN